MSDKSYPMNSTNIKSKSLYSKQNSSMTRRDFLANSTLITSGFSLVSLLELAKAQNGTSSKNTDEFQVNIAVDVSKPIGRLRQIWRFFGADEPNYAYMKNGRKLLKELGELNQKNVFFRAHNLLCSGDGTPALKWGSTGAYNEDKQGNPVYDWTILDRIFDTYLKSAVRPYVEIGFMPKLLSTNPEPYQHKWTPKAGYNEIYTGWAYPPKDYKKWGELVYQWAKHCVEKYGKDEVRSWYWETWNEANIGYWRGTEEEFHKLHDYAIDGVRRAIPDAHVGGPDVAGSGGNFQRNFLEHCLYGTNFATGKTGTPFDFVSFHAKGSPRYVQDHVQMGISNQLRDVNAGFQIIASFPELKETPIIIGESDPEGCAACQGVQLGYRNGTMYSSYTAACFARKHDLADRHGVNFEGALTWAFEFEDQPFFAGFRSLASNGIDKPVLNVFRMFSKMSGQRLEVVSDGAVSLDTMIRQGVRGTADVSGFASLDNNKLCVMLWHYHDDDVPGPDASVELLLTNLPLSFNNASLEHYRIDEEHSNAYTLWQKMDKPQNPTDEQYAQLEKAGELTQLSPREKIKINQSNINLHIKLPRKAVSLLVIERSS
jgi:xylan 1,4-beta-xylosidase